MFLNDLEHGTPSKFVDDTELGEAAGTAEDCAAVQRHRHVGKMGCPEPHKAQSKKKK